MTDTRPRNVLLISADQWRGDCLGSVGHPLVRTPNLDALARDGVLFRNHFTQCTPCGPARTSLLTGLYMMTHRSVRNGTPLDNRHSNVASEARKAGFDPVLFGYTDTARDPRSVPVGDLAEWVALRRRLAEVASVRRLDILVLGKGGAIVDIQHEGGTDSLRTALAQRDLTLEEADGGWRLLLAGRGGQRP